MRGALPQHTTPPPLVVAAAGMSSWVDVLTAYSRCCRSLSGIYTPSANELVHGLQQMPTAWSTSLFYYNVVKGFGGGAQVHPAVAAAAVRQFRQCNNTSAMRRVFEEDIGADGSGDPESALTVAAHTGMWEKCLELMRRNPTLRRRRASRALVVNTLCAQHQWELALLSIAQPPRMELTPAMVRPLVRELSSRHQTTAALQLVSASRAAGYDTNAQLLSTVVGVLRSVGNWQAVLETVQSAGLLTASRTESQKLSSLYGHVMGCLYDYDFYGNYTIDEVVTDIVSRMNPRDLLFHPLQRRKQFRMVSHAEVHSKFHSVIFPLQNALFKVLGVPHLYTRSIETLVAEAAQTKTALVVYDTNFLIQCVSKNLALDTILTHARARHPGLDQFTSFAVVVPFTVLMEAHRLIWAPQSRLRHSVRMLMWSRLLAFAQLPSTYALALTSDYPSTALSLVSRMAYAKVGASDIERDPDLRILNVCLSVQHFLRARQLERTQGLPTPEGIMLFSFMKYHVRRYTDTVKGCATEQLLLCTLDKRLTTAADAAGINCFPLGASSQSNPSTH